MNVTDRTKQLTGGEKESGSTDFLQKTWVVCALALVCTFLWGSASPCIKLGYALFQIPSSETWTQVLFAGTRFVLAGVLTILIGSVLNRKMLVPTKSSIPSIAKLGLFQTILQYIFQILSKCSIFHKIRIEKCTSHCISMTTQFFHFIHTCFISNTSSNR